MREGELVRDLMEACDYVGMGRLVPRLLRELHAASHGPDRETALWTLATNTFETMNMLRSVGYPAESWLAAE